MSKEIVKIEDVGFAEFNSGPKIITVLASPEYANVSSFVEKQTKQFFTIDVNETTKQLLTVTKLINLAYAAARGTKVSGAMAELQPLFLKLLSTAQSTCGSFVVEGVRSVALYSKAVKSIKDGKMDRAITIAASTSKIAANMANLTNGLIEETKALNKKAMEASTTAHSEEAVTREAFEKTQESIQRLQKLQEEWQNNIAIMQDDITRAKEQEKEDREMEKEKDKNEFIKGIVGGIANGFKTFVGTMTGGAGQTKAPESDPKATEAPQPVKVNEAMVAEMNQKIKDLEVAKLQLAQAEEELLALNEQIEDDQKAKKEAMSSVHKESTPKEEGDKEKNKDERDPTEVKKDLEKEIQELKDKVKAIGLKVKELSMLSSVQNAAEERRALQTLMREQNKELMSAVSELAGTKTSRNFLAQALVALRVVIQTLARIIVIFVAMKEFWESMNRQLTAISNDIDKETLSILAEADVDELKQSIIESGLKWVTVVRNCALGNNRLQDSQIEMKKFMFNLPSMEEIPEIIQSYCKDAQIMIEDQNKLIEGKDK